MLVADLHIPCYEVVPFTEIDEKIKKLNARENTQIQAFDLVKFRIHLL